MTDYQLPYFGQIDLDSLEDYYDANVSVNGKEIPITLTFDETSIDKDVMDMVNNFIGNLYKHDKQNRLYLDTDYNNENGETVRYYLNYHLNNLDKKDLSGLIDLNDNKNEIVKQLLTNLQLIQVGFYPHNEDYLAIFDYSIGQNLTNHDSN